MKTINYTQFKKDFKDKELKAVNVCPYFEYEKWSAGTIYITDAVNEVTTVTYKRKPTATLIPKKGDITETLIPHYKLLTRLIRVDAPCIPVFDETGAKLVQISKPNKQ